MHSSYALSADDFSVERNGTTEPLAALWPGGWQPSDRLGVLLANPMDAVGCSNLICATITLFYDQLRAIKGTGNFFRYSDVYLFGVGCEPGDFNQLDVWPLHKFVSILQPSTEAVIEAVNDRRITLLAVPETGARCRGEVVLSTWNALLAQVRCVVTYSSRTGRARGGDGHRVEPAQRRPDRQAWHPAGRAGLSGRLHQGGRGDPQAEHLLFDLSAHTPRSDRGRDADGPPAAAHLASAQAARHHVCAGAGRPALVDGDHPRQRGEDGGALRHQRQDPQSTF